MRTKSVGQLEKEKLVKGKGVQIDAPHSNTPFLETHYKTEEPYPLCLKYPNGHETINFAQLLLDTNPFINSEF